MISDYEIERINCDDIQFNQFFFSFLKFLHLPPKESPKVSGGQQEVNGGHDGQVQSEVEKIAKIVICESDEILDYPDLCFLIGQISERVRIKLKLKFGKAENIEKIKFILSNGNTQNRERNPSIKQMNPSISDGHVMDFEP